MDGMILAINSGSSSQEYGIFKHDGTCVLNAYYEHSPSGIKVTFNTDKSWTEVISEKTYEQSLNHFLESSKLSNQVLSVGIRVVAPSSRLLEHQIFSKELAEFLSSVERIAPLHIRLALQQYKAVKEVLPQAEIFAISDSAFHRTMLSEARSYAIDQKVTKKFDLYRFGYHGISVQSVVKRVDKNEKLIVCHLGSGASLTAIKNGKTVDTSMGYSPLEGLVMATRSGNIDIKAALELKHNLELSDQDLTEYLNEKSGLFGLSGTSSDIRKLLELEERGSKEAQLALSMMVYRVKNYIGAYSAVLNGLDTLVFTATVGERSSAIRGRISKSLEFLGVDIDEHANVRAVSGDEISRITKDSSKVKVLVIPAEELKQIAEETNKLA